MNAGVDFARRPIMTSRARVLDSYRIEFDSATDAADDTALSEGRTSAQQA